MINVEKQLNNNLNFPHKIHINNNKSNNIYNENTKINNFSKELKENKIEVERLNRAIKAGKVMAIGGGIGCGVGVASLFAGGLLALSCPALTIPYLFYIGFACIPSGIALVGSGAVVSTVSGIIKNVKEKD